MSHRANTSWAMSGRWRTSRTFLSNSWAVVAERPSTVSGIALSFTRYTITSTAEERKDKSFQQHLISFSMHNNHWQFICLVNNVNNYFFYLQTHNAVTEEVASLAIALSQPPSYRNRQRGMGEAVFLCQNKPRSESGPAHIAGHQV